MTSKDQAWVAAKLAKAVDMSRPLGEVLDILALHAHAEMCRWCGKRVTLPKLRQLLHEEVVAGNMGTAGEIARATALALSRIVNKEESLCVGKRSRSARSGRWSALSART
jgi:hypothetical protein